MLDEKQIALRRTGITGTDVGALLGLSEFRSPLEVWLDKKGRAEPVDLTPAIKRGLYLEDGILQWYVADTGATDVERPGTMLHPHNVRIMATPDAVVRKPMAGTQYVDQRTGVEVKAPGPYMEHGWGEPGTDQVPQAYLAQAVFEMAVLDVERLDFAALLGGELRIFPVQRNRAVEGLLIEKALAFWRDYVEADRPPPPTWRARDQEWIRSAFPRATKAALPWDALTPEQRHVIQEYLLAHESAAKAERELVEWELRTKLIVGEASGIDGIPPDVAATRYTRIDWRENGSGSPAWRKVAEALRDGAAWEDAVKANTGTPARPFVPRRAKKGDE